VPVRKKRRRYLSFRVDCTRSLITKEIWYSIQRRVLDLYGVQGLSQVEPVLIDFDEDTQTGVLRSNRDKIRSLRAVLALITEVGGAPAAVRVCRTSGTIKSLKKKT
jgi:ribonuclease P/MRP protein subunit POP5